MLSGIGPRDQLSAVNITVKKDLSAVGSNFRDHQVLYIRFTLSNQAIPNPDMLVTNADPEFNATAAEGDVALFLPFKDFSSSYANITALISEQDATAYLPERYAKTEALLKGFLSQRKILVEHYLSDYAATIQKPLARGTLTLNITNLSANPVIVRNAFHNPVNRIMLGELRYSPVETGPRSQYQINDEMYDASIKAGAFDPTYAHSSGACTLMPEELGGCVNPQLRVYGVKRLRVMDTSTLPLIPEAHLQATMYAVAEKTVDIIKAS
ncbi:GMC oxidoreductase [Pyrenophora teres f. teres]|uniref:GMC oxidoreductase n=1 Tax=Pyrenophora teres f. teres TaxID=97479 RepID=A0A6S6WIZ8_9PLEO|nr:GMC oxidoreductase [Pyrenophora teres f. teres]